MPSRAALTIALSLLSACASTPPNQPWTSGQYDDQIRAALAHSLQDLTLRETSLQTVAPQYHVNPPPASLTWQQAVAQADADFKNNPDKRALFLARHMTKDGPADRLADLHLIDSGFSLGTGSGVTRSYCLGMPSYKIIPGSGKPDSDTEINVDIIFPDPPATLNFFISGLGAVASSPSLQLINFDFKGVHYQSIYFDTDEKLQGFESDSTPRPGFMLTVGGNTSGEGGVNYFYAIISTTTFHYVEELKFSPDLKLVRRYVRDPASGNMLYADKFEDEIPIRRYYYKITRTDGGYMSEIDREEDLRNPRHAPTKNQ